MSRCGFIMLSICISDIMITVAGLHLGYFSKEINPILAYYFINWGFVGLIVLKIFLVAMPIFLIETMLRFYPGLLRKINLYYRVAIFLYVAFFTVDILLQL